MKRYWMMSLKSVQIIQQLNGYNDLKIYGNFYFTIRLISIIFGYGCVCKREDYYVLCLNSFKYIIYFMAFICWLITQFMNFMLCCCVLFDFLFKTLGRFLLHFLLTWFKYEVLQKGFLETCIIYFYIRITYFYWCIYLFLFYLLTHECRWVWLSKEVILHTSRKRRTVSWIVLNFLHTFYWIIIKSDDELCSHLYHLRGRLTKSEESI